MNQRLVAMLVGRNLPYKVIGARLTCSHLTVKMHAENAARALPGDLPPKWKLVFWWRGATEEQLTGVGLE